VCKGCKHGHDRTSNHGNRAGYSADLAQANHFPTQSFVKLRLLARHSHIPRDRFEKLQIRLG